LQNVEKAAGLQSGLTPNEVSKMSAQELFEHNQHAAPGGTVGVVQKKLVRAEREAQNAREKAELAQRTAAEAAASGLKLGSAYEPSVEGKTYANDMFVIIRLGF
jgi:hypothetical protein